MLVLVIGDCMAERYSAEAEPGETRSVLSKLSMLFVDCLLVGSLRVDGLFKTDEFKLFLLEEFELRRELFCILDLLLGVRCTMFPDIAA